MKTDFKKFDLKNITPENKKKLIFGGAMVVLVGGFLFFTTGNDTKDKPTDDYNLPDSEAQRYNSKTEALTNGKSEAQTTDLGDYYKSDSINTNSVDFQNLDNQISSLQNGGSQPQATPQASYNPPPSSSSGGGGGAPRNSHNVYGDYDMWQNKEPSNNRIGYSNKSNVPTKSKPIKKNEPQYDVVSENATSSPMTTVVNYDTPVKQNVTSSSKVRAKLITQGYASNGKSISFVLLEPTTIAGKKTKKGQVITGIAKEQNNRLSVNFSEIKIDGQRFPASMQLIGFDGYEGFPISTNTTQDNNSQLKDRAISETNRIPVVGGIISSVTTKKVDNRLKLGENVECTIAIFN